MSATEDTRLDRLFTSPDQPPPAVENREWELIGGGGRFGSWWVDGATTGTGAPTRTTTCTHWPGIRTDATPTRWRTSAATSSSGSKATRALGTSGGAGADPSALRPAIPSRHHGYRVFQTSRASVSQCELSAT